MKKILIICLLFLLVGCSNEPVKIKCSERQKLLDEGAVLIDVRSANEYRYNHLERAINIPYDEIENQIKTRVTDLNTKIIVYCQSGGRSKIAAQTLIDLGYKNVYDIGTINNC